MGKHASSVHWLQCQVTWQRGATSINIFSLFPLETFATNCTTLFIKRQKYHAIQDKDSSACWLFSLRCLHVKIQIPTSLIWTCWFTRVNVLVSSKSSVLKCSHPQVQTVKARLCLQVLNKLKTTRVLQCFLVKGLLRNSMETFICCSRLPHWRGAICKSALSEELKAVC